ncbi:MAG: BON domain-containing protein [Bdellovibrio sp.]
MNGFYYTPNDTRETYQRYERNYDGSLRFRKEPEPLKSYAGVGPKNYHRSDERIYEEICEILTLDPDIDASEIHVEVKDGLVTLSGTVETKTLKTYAKQAISNVFGVKEIRNEIKLPEIENRK